MDAPLNLIPGSISAILASVNETGILTEADRYGLMASVFDDSLDEEERRAINRVLYSVLRGRIKVMPEYQPSVVSNV